MSVERGWISQVLKDAPRLHKEEGDFPERWRYLQLFSVDLPLIVPCVRVSYYSKFLVNSFITPTCTTFALIIAFEFLKMAKGLEFVLHVRL